MNLISMTAYYEQQCRHATARVFARRLADEPDALERFRYDPHLKHGISFYRMNIQLKMLYLEDMRSMIAMPGIHVLSE